jgi:hypothetical protein
VRLDGLTRPNVLLSSAQADLGAVQWSIKADGGLAFQLRGKDPKKKSPSKLYRFQSKSLIGKTERGGWHHLAMVYNGEEGKVSHFIDGNLASENKVSKPAMVPVVLGDAQIGNASENNSSGKPLLRHTNGRIDEFAIFGRAMGADEIAHMASFGPQG